VARGFFTVGLDESAVQRNLQLIRERRWFHAPIVYTNGLRNVLTFGKTPAGEQAFAAWFANNP
jgi:hypothetical protein